MYCIMYNDIDQGYLYTMGSNQDGKLGIGSSRVLSANVPTLV